MSAGTAESRSSTWVVVWSRIRRPSLPIATTPAVVRVTPATWLPLIITSVSPISSAAAGCRGPDIVLTESPCQLKAQPAVAAVDVGPGSVALWMNSNPARSEEHTSELQSPYDLV